MFEPLVLFVKTFGFVGGFFGIAAAVTTPTASAARCTAATSGPPAVVILCPAAPCHRRAGRRRRSSSSTVVANEEVSGLSNGEHCSRALPSSSKTAVPRRLGRDDGRRMSPRKRRTGEEGGQRATAFGGCGHEATQECRVREAIPRRQRRGSPRHPCPGLPSTRSTSTVAFPAPNPLPKVKEKGRREKQTTSTRTDKAR